MRITITVDYEPGPDLAGSRQGHFYAVGAMLEEAGRAMLRSQTGLGSPDDFAASAVYVGSSAPFLSEAPVGRYSNTLTFDFDVKVTPRKPQN